MMGEALRKRRHGTGRRSGQSWYVDETYLKVHGRWCYLYRAIDRDGNLIDTMLSATRDMRAAQRFFRSARSVVGFVPDRVTRAGNLRNAMRWVGDRATDIRVGPALCAGWWRGLSAHGCPLPTGPADLRRVAGPR